MKCDPELVVKSPSIFISRSCVKCPRSALRMREKSAAARWVGAPALQTESLHSSSYDHAGCEGRPGLLQVGVGASEVPKHVTATICVRLHIEFRRGGYLVLQLCI